MSRPAAAVHRVIKAYDVRGLVGSEIDESFVSDVGAAFATLMHSEGAQQVVIGYDMRDSSPSLAAAFAAGVTGQGLDVVRIVAGLDLIARLLTGPCRSASSPGWI
jgi:phosphomannomutase